VVNPNGKRGTAWETAVERYLAPLDAQRKPKRGARDESDVHLAHWALECKNEKTAHWAAYVDEATVEAASAGKPFGAAVVKRRRGTGSPGTVETAYVVMSLEIFRAAELVAEHLRARVADLEAEVQVLSRQFPGARWLAEHGAEPGG
jgi:hypothetical protein